MDFAVTFGDLSLKEDVETWAEAGDTRVNAEAVAKRHGVYVSDAVLDGRIVNVTGKIVGSSDANAFSQLMEMSHYLNQGEQKLKLRDDKFLLAYKSRFNWGLIPGTEGRGISFSIEFLCADPFLYGDSVDEVSGDWDFYTHYGSMTATLIDTCDIVYPTFTISCLTPGDSIDEPALCIGSQLAGAEYGDFIYRGPLYFGETMIVNPMDFTVKKKHTSASEWTDILSDWEGPFPYMTAGVNYIGPMSEGHGWLKVNWRARELS